MAWHDGVECECGNCGANFVGTKRQAKRVKYEKAPVYCSPTCRKVAMQRALRKPKRTYGPCPKCGEMFESRQPKKFCSMKCYTSSEQFTAHLKRIAPIGRSRPRKRRELTCPNCGETFHPRTGQKYCSQICYREYMAARFDRWVASPETITIPKTFDEFLTQAELPCLVEGCDWRGAHLSLHMNQAHGVQAEDFKRAAGFNLSTGVVSAPLHRSLCGRELYGVSETPKWWFGPKGRGKPPPKRKINKYRSLESKEHHLKANALLRIERGPKRTCGFCGNLFQQKTKAGRAKYCSKVCQQSEMSRREWEKIHPMICSYCNAEFKGNRSQKRRISRGLSVFCSIKCRQFRNAQFRRKQPHDSTAPPHDRRREISTV